MPNGLLLIDKPAGLRSAECVAKVKRAFNKNTRVGHAGTLDSTASGLLVTLIGTATRLSDYIMKMPKTYEAMIKLGAATDTCDASGSVVFSKDAANISEAEFDGVLYSFLGTNMQLPPEISALKIGGKPAHKLARQGKPAKLEPRLVTVTSIKRLSPISNCSVKISVVCGKGTYIRAIARDIGELLGCGAHVESLRRLSTGPFRAEDALNPADLSGAPEKLRSIREAANVFHRVILTEDAEKKLSSGLCVPLAEAGRYVPGSLELKQGLCAEGKNMIGFVDSFSSAEEGGTVFLKPRVNVLIE